MKRIQLSLVISCIAVAHACTACSLTRPDHGAIQGTGSVKTLLPDQIYLKQAGVAYTMDVAIPRKPNGAAVIWVVSGGWVSNHNAIMNEIFEAGCAKGFTVIQVVHGAQPKYTVPEILRTLHRAVRFARSKASDWSFESKKIGISGGSAGGHLSLMIAAQQGIGRLDAKDPVDAQPSTVQSVGVFYPPTDFSNWGKSNVAAFENGMLRTAFGGAFGVTAQTTPDELTKLAQTLSPARHFSSAMPPTLFVHGTADALVPIQQSQIAVERLKALGVKAELITVPDVGHGWPKQDVEFRKILDWHRQTLGLG